MVKLLLRLLVSTLSVFFSAWIVGHGVELDNFSVAIVVALVLAVFNITLKPLLILLTLPVTVVTFGLFLLVVNAVIIMAADSLIGGFEVLNFWYALLFSLVLSVVSSLLHRLGERT